MLIKEGVLIQQDREEAFLEKGILFLINIQLNSIKLLSLTYPYSNQYKSSIGMLKKVLKIG
jgi:hypothetical protein